MANYLYNGEERPAPPEYDAATYPYAAITQKVFEDGSVSATESFVVFGGDSYVSYGDDGTIYLSFTKAITYVTYLPDYDDYWGGGVVSNYDETMQWPLYKAGGTDEEGLPTGAATLWSNFDIYNEDDTLYLAASEPVPVAKKFPLKSWLIGFVRGLASKPMPIGKQEREPVAYLYNGVRLPKLPDMTGYPYAVLSYDDTDYVVNGSYIGYLILSDRAFFYREKLGAYYSIYTTGSYIEYQLVSDTRLLEYATIIGLSESIITANVWTRSRTMDNADGLEKGATKNPIWANCNIDAEDGTNYLEESDPVPVYE